ncbi:MAG TPA: TVP38/TMEM64 family protein [Rhizobiaceae bacterium]|nr:TVP38/TMEM64 family protein [Rhizobiaceae bacterium]
MTTMVDKNEATGRSGIVRFMPLAIIAGGLLFGYAMGWHRFLSFEYLIESRETLAVWVSANPVLAPLLFGAVYALATAFSFPAASLLTVFGGLLFGWAIAAPVVAVAATLGATALFIAARSAFGDFFRSKAGGVLARLKDGFEKDAFGYLFVLRLAPLFPFWIVNIAPAFFKVSLRDYVTATFLGILPGVVAYSWLGQGLDSVISAAKAAGRDVGLADIATPEIRIAFIALAIVAAIPMIVRKWRARI